jgi:DNA-binding protein YbaB
MFAILRAEDRYMAAKKKSTKRKPKKSVTRETWPNGEVTVAKRGDRTKVRVVVNEVIIEARSPEELQAKIGETIAPALKAIRDAFGGGE